MIVFWFFGFCLISLEIYLLIHTRNMYEESVFRVWHLLCMLAISLVPFLNIICGVIIGTGLAISYGDGYWKLNINNKIWKFLNKKI